MGRWRRKRHNDSKSKSTASDGSEKPSTNKSNSEFVQVLSTETEPSKSKSSSLKQEARGRRASSFQHGFSEVDRSRLLHYLTEYRDGAERVCFPTNLFGTGSNNAVAPGDLSTDAVTIAGHTFPCLNDDNLGRPYLSLPKTLTSKQRRRLHEFCVDVDLFHTGVGKEKARYIVISIHSDGFLYTPDLDDPEDIIIISDCRPWFNRTDHRENERDGDDTNTHVTCSVKEATRKARTIIEGLIDQPGICLRDDHDIIDFKTFDAEDLSSVDPPGFGQDDSWMLVDTADKMQHCAQELHGASEIAFDIKMYNKSKFTQITCLLQITSDMGKDYIVDVLVPGVWDSVSLLAPLFADVTICKIGHAIGGMDVPSLHRDFGIFVVNAFDTYEAANVLELEKRGLAQVCEYYGLRDSDEYELLKGTYQRSDWRKRPLTEPMIRYGRSDVKYLIKLRRLMIRDLVRKQLWNKYGSKELDKNNVVATALAASIRAIQQEEGDVELENKSDDTVLCLELDTFNAECSIATSEENGSNIVRKSVCGANELRMHLGLMKVIVQSQQRCLDHWHAKTEKCLKNAALLTTLKRAAKGETNWTASNMDLYKSLVSWRTEVAQKVMVLDDFICPLELLVTIACKKPVCEASLRRIIYILPGLLKDKIYRQQLLSIVKKETGTTVTSNIPSYQSRRTTADSSPLQNKNAKKKLQAYARLTSLFDKTLLFGTIAIGAITFITLTYKKKS